jgi:arylsulfatase A-like enzyme
MLHARRMFGIVCALFFVGKQLHAQEPTVTTQHPNILFIAVDDLNHWVGHLGRNPQTITPNIDRLAARGVTFTNAHCAAPSCNPSRTAILTGKRPSTTGVYLNSIPYRKAVKADDSMFKRFKKSGYETMAMGKLWHGGVGFEEQWTQAGGNENDQVVDAPVDDRSINGIKFGIVRGGDDAIVDTPTADFGISQLNRKHEKPFVLALGFHKPHMPWNVPQKYYDLHPLDQIELPKTQGSDLEDIPLAGIEMAKPKGDHKDVVDSGRWKEAIQAYLAAISYVDGQIGRVLDALDASSYSHNTIIVLWGDHGWHLGEKEHWRKFALWEESTRAPLIWVAPGLTTAGTRIDHAVELISIYPTLFEQAKLPVPNDIDGKSIAELIANPHIEWNGTALTTHGMNNHAVRDNRWRYIRYSDGSEELYDHHVDPYEWTNLANSPELIETKHRLSLHLPKVNAAPANSGDANNP